jgi:hypothetical protein
MKRVFIILEHSTINNISGDDPKDFTNVHSVYTSDRKADRELRKLNKERKVTGSTYSLDDAELNEGK